MFILKKVILNPGQIVKGFDTKIATDIEFPAESKSGSIYRFGKSRSHGNAVFALGTGGTAPILTEKNLCHKFTGQKARMGTAEASITPGVYARPKILESGKPRSGRATSFKKRYLQ